MRKKAFMILILTQFFKDVTVHFILKQLGRKPLFLLGMTVMFVTDIASAVVMLAFDLENSAGGLSVSQKVAGYFVLILVCIFLAGANISIG